MRASVFLPLALLLGCGPLAGPPAVAMRASAPATEARTPEARTTEARTPEALDCVRLDVLRVDAAREIDAGAPASAGLFLYAEALSTLYPLRPLLERAGDVSWLDGPAPDLVGLDEDLSVGVSPTYRRDGTCGRIAVYSRLAGDIAEAFYGFDRDALVLADSLGQPAGVLAPLGGADEVRASALPTVLPGAVRFDAAALVAEQGRLALADVIPFGRWYARPAGVRYQGSDLVVVHTCDPYRSSDRFCGLANDGDRPFADVPGPLVTTFAVTRQADGTTLRVEPFDDGGTALSAIGITPGVTASAHRYALSPTR